MGRGMETEMARRMGAERQKDKRRRLRREGMWRGDVRGIDEGWRWLIWLGLWLRLGQVGNSGEL